MSDKWEAVAVIAAYAGSVLVSLTILGTLVFRIAS